MLMACLGDVEREFNACVKMLQTWHVKEAQKIDDLVYIDTESCAGAIPRIEPHAMLDLIQDEEERRVVQKYMDVVEKEAMRRAEAAARRENKPVSIALNMIDAPLALRRVMDQSRQEEDQRHSKLLKELDAKYDRYYKKLDLAFASEIDRGFAHLKKKAT